MPRKVTTRKWLGGGGPQDAGVALLIEFMVTGDLTACVRRMKARGLPYATWRVVWQHAKLAEFWREHGAVIRRAARRRGVEAYGEIYEGFRDGAFAPEDSEPSEPQWPDPDPKDPRLTLFREHGRAGAARR